MHLLSSRIIPILGLITLVHAELPVRKIQGALPSNVSSGTYLATGQLIVQANDSVHIQAGVNIYFEPFAGITVKGMLRGRGTADRKILFASNKELTDTGTPGPADWNGIIVDEQADGLALDHTVIRHSTFGIEITSRESVALLRDVSFMSNALSNLSIGGRQILATDMIIGSNPVTYAHDNREHSELSVHLLVEKYENIAGARTGELKPGEYCVDGTLLIPAGKELTIQSPAIIRFTPESSILVKGVLKTGGGCAGMDENYAKLPGVLFTSYRDGTAPEISGSGPAPGDWGGIRLASGSGGAYLRSVKIDYSTYAFQPRGSATVQAIEVDFGAHNGVLREDGFRSFPADGITFDE